MGARGPQPTPTAVLRLHGSWRGGTRAGEPQVEPGKPKCPKTLGRDRHKLFRAVCRLIEKEAPECLTRLDGAAVERFVVYLARWRQFETEIERMTTLGGYLGTFKNGPGRLPKLGVGLVGLPL